MSSIFQSTQHSCNWQETSKIPDPDFPPEVLFLHTLTDNRDDDDNDDEWKVCQHLRGFPKFLFVFPFTDRLLGHHETRKRKQS